ncbi:hypothetical protein [Qipengyuania qiaonensis]|uniref:Uncharacterized protein n=1 Tax=Qipengyuania qiaonensis TaxID=2867240 RepID=A0ABS7J9N0_9SPHN|nr:hypothetical protein [Qipengyuania qiaonensis]MBX7482779.1 hypothetical protein [Qipengyuania qiaonensis]
MAGDAVMLSGAGAAILGVAVLRHSWGRSVRSVPLNTAGWLLLAIGAISGWAAAGAWGLAVAALVATGTACLALALAAFDRPKHARRIRNGQNGTVSATPGGWRRGLLTFVLTGPLALAVSVAVALAARTLAISWPLAEADGNVMVLGLVPLVWPLLACAMLMNTTRRPQIALLAVPLALALLPLVVLGSRS